MQEPVTLQVDLTNPRQLRRLATALEHRPAYYVICRVLGSGEIVEYDGPLASFDEAVSMSNELNLHLRGQTLVWSVGRF